MKKRIGNKTYDTSTAAIIAENNAPQKTEILMQTPRGLLFLYEKYIVVGTDITKEKITPYETEKAMEWIESVKPYIRQPLDKKAESAKNRAETKAHIRSNINLTAAVKERLLTFVQAAKKENPYEDISMSKVANEAITEWLDKQKKERTNN